MALRKSLIIQILTLSLTVFGEAPSHETGLVPARAKESELKSLIEAFSKASSAQPELEALKESYFRDGFVDYRGKRLGSMDSKIFLNLAFLHLSQLRLLEEIAEMEANLLRPFPRPWMKAAEKERLATKKTALDELRNLVPAVQRRNIPLAEDLIHLKELVALSQEKVPPGRAVRNALVSEPLEKATGTMGEIAVHLRKHPKEALDQVPGAQKLLTELPELEGLAARNRGLPESRAFLEAQSLLMALSRQHSRENALFQLVDKALAESSGRNSAARKFLAEVSVRPDKEPRKSADLSSQFHAPLSQGKMFSCVSHALTSDMGTHSDEAPSANYGYSLLSWGQMLLDEELGAENLDSGKIPVRKVKAAATAIAAPENFPDNLKQLWAEIGAAQGQKNAAVENVANRGVSFDLAEAIFKKHGLPAEKNHPSVSDDFIPPSLNQVAGRTHVLKQVKRLREPPTWEEVRRLLDQGQPFQMVIASDARFIQEDWVKVDAFRGSIPHVLNVVGYGEGIDPVDNKSKPFLWIRDSFTSGKFHYKASVDSMLPYTMEVLRVTEVEELKEPVTYQKLP